MKKTRKILWGLALLAAAALVIAGNFYDIRVLDILIMLLMAFFLIKGIARRNFMLILFPAAILLIINSDRLGISVISPWSILAAALLGSIGLNVLFPKSGRHWVKYGHVGTHEGGGQYGKNPREFVQADPGGKVYLGNHFGEAVKYLTGGMLEQVRLENHFGSMSVYFDNAELRNHTARVYAESNFGNMVLYIPATWNVVLLAEKTFGSVRERGQCDPHGENRLEVSAEVSFGEIELRYI